jgi:hypothetical protein
MAVEVKVDEYEQFLKTLGGRIKQLRKERGLPLRDMVLQHGYNDSQCENMSAAAPSIFNPF